MTVEEMSKEERISQVENICQQSHSQNCTAKLLG